MSMALQNLLAGIAPAGKAASAGKASNGAETGMLSFNAAITGLLAGEEESANTTLTDPSSLLEGLMIIAARVGMSDSSEQEDMAEQLIERLSVDGEEIDQMLEQDPALMLMLQGWLLQVNAVLNPNDQALLQGDQIQSHLPPLAQEASTIRFALLDALTQLSSAEQLHLKGEQSNQANKLMMTLELMLQGAGLNRAAEGAQAKGQTANQQLMSLFNSQVSNVTAGTTSLSQHAQQMDNASVRVLNANASEMNVSMASELSSDDQGSVFAQGTVTAGQLAMRDNLQGALRMPATPVPVEQFADEMNRFVVQRLDFVRMQGVTEAKISLYPENLGQVDIRITMQNGQLVAQFMTEHASARDLIDQQMGQLRAALQSQGIQVEKLEVTQNSSLQSHMYQDGRQSNTGQQQSGNHSKNGGESSSDALQVAEMTEEWNEWIREQEEEVNGSTFTAQA